MKNKLIKSKQHGYQIMLLRDRKNFKNKLRNRVYEYRNAMVDLSWKGSKDPEEFDMIDKNAKVQGKKLIDFVMNLYDSKVDLEEKCPNGKTL